jgi:hypothetical protein
MDWVKRNLAFVIGGAVALVLLLFSGYYLYSNSAKNNAAREQLEGEYNELQRLSNLKPHPGKGKVDNIRLAGEQREALLKVMERLRAGFAPIPAEPNSETVTGEEFSASLRRTLEQLTRLAENSSVLLPTNYSFSFEAEKRLVKFAPGSLNRLAEQLGEVKVISEILCRAKVNKLTGLRRQRVSTDDLKGPQTDYLTEAATSNDLAVIAPYEITFESFGAELAEVMTGFANSPHGLVIKGINVKPAASVLAASSRYGYGAEGSPMGEFYPPTYTAPPPAAYAPEGYAPEGYGGGGGAGSIRQPTFTRPTFNTGTGAGGNYPYTAPVQPTYTAPPAGYPGAAAAPVSQTLIDEQPLSVTILVQVIRLLPIPNE